MKSAICFGVFQIQQTAYDFTKEYNHKPPCRLIRQGGCLDIRCTERTLELVKGWLLCDPGTAFDHVLRVVDILIEIEVVNSPVSPDFSG